MILKALTTTKVEIDTQINFKSLVYHITWCRRMYGTTISWTYHKIYSLLLSCFWGAWRRNFLELTYIFYIATIQNVNTDHMPAMNQKSMPRSFKSLYIPHHMMQNWGGIYGSTFYWTYHQINGPTLNCFWGSRRTCRHAWNILPPQISTPHDHALQIGNQRFRIGSHDVQQPCMCQRLIISPILLLHWTYHNFDGPAWIEELPV